MCERDTLVKIGLLGETELLRKMSVPKGLRVEIRSFG